MEQATTQPGISFVPSSSTSIQFHLNLIEIREIDQFGRNVFVLRDWGHVNNTNQPLLFGDETNTSNVEMISTSTAENNAYIKLVLWHFEVETYVPSLKKTYQSNSCKLNLYIQNWPFRDTKHSLALVFQSAINTTNLTSLVLDMKTGPDGGLMWFIMTVDEVSLYTRFVKEVEIDNTTRMTTFHFNETNHTITATVPHFWFSLYLDPDYYVLVNETQSTDVSLTLLIEVIVPVIVLVAVVAILIIVALPKIKLRYQITRGNRSLSESKDMEMARLDRSVSSLSSTDTN